LSAPPEQLARVVTGDAAQPGGEGARRAQAGQGAKGVEEGILGEVARLFGIAELAGEVGQDGRVVALGQLVGRAGRAGEDGGDQILSLPSCSSPPIWRIPCSSRSSPSYAPARR